MALSSKGADEQTLIRCLLSQVVWPTKEVIQHGQSPLNDALFFVRKQCEPLGDKIDLSAVQRLNDRSPLLGDRDGDTPAITGRVHLAEPALALHARDKLGHAGGTYPCRTGQVADAPRSVILEQRQDRGLGRSEHLLLHPPREELRNSHDTQAQLFRQSSCGQWLSFD